MKLTLLGKAELRVSVFSHGTPEQFLMHVQAALDAIRQKSIDGAYDKACKREEECIKGLQKAQGVFDDYQGLDENPPKKSA